MKPDAACIYGRRGRWEVYVPRVHGMMDAQTNVIQPWGSTLLSTHSTEEPSRNNRIISSLSPRF